MIKIPRMTKIKLVIGENTDEIIGNTVETIYNVAYGSALMTGCKVERI
jgi:hypothetical protein